MAMDSEQQAQLMKELDEMFAEEDRRAAERRGSVLPGHLVRYTGSGWSVHDIKEFTTDATYRVLDTGGGSSGRSIVTTTNIPGVRGYMHGDDFEVIGEGPMQLFEPILAADFEPSEAERKVIRQLAGKEPGLWLVPRIFGLKSEEAQGRLFNAGVIELERRPAGLMVRLSKAGRGLAAKLDQST